MIRTNTFSRGPLIRNPIIFSNTFWIIKINPDINRRNVRNTLSNTGQLRRSYKLQKS